MCQRSVLTHCPVRANHSHGDSQPSLSVNDGFDKVLYHCHRGCSQEQVSEALKGFEGSNELRVITTPPPIRVNTKWEFVCSYPYLDPVGVLVAEHGRFDTGTGKAFSWRIPGHTWKEGLMGQPIHSLPIYGLPAALRAETVYICEGEKAADACIEHGLTAVCVGGGAAQTAFGDAFTPIQGKRIIIWPDNDDIGRAFAGRVASLFTQAEWVIPHLPPKGDAFDYFLGGGTAEGLLTLVQAASGNWLSRYEGLF
ncbi:MAG: hypothetical protein JW395_2187 [Nitrospira sp.]|nr:hypothetical protein [Nitrospira sp.]